MLLLVIPTIINIHKSLRGGTVLLVPKVTEAPLEPLALLEFQDDLARKVIEVTTVCLDSMAGPVTPVFPGPRVILEHLDKVKWE